MRSVADTLREDTRRRDAALDPQARVDLALALGDDDVARLADSRQVTVAEARAAIARSRGVGRRSSVANAD